MRNGSDAVFDQRDATRCFLNDCSQLCSSIGNRQIHVVHRTTEHVLSVEYLTAFSALDEESQIIKEVRLTGGAQIRDTRCARKSIAFITGTGILIAVEGAIYIISKSTFEGRQERRRTTSTGLLTRQTRWEVVFVSFAATKNELLAFAGGRVEKPIND